MAELSWSVMSLRCSPILILLCGCATSDGSSDLAGPGDGAAGDTAAEAGRTDSDGDGSIDDGGFVTDAILLNDAPTAGPTKVYANTDKDLWQMDPVTKSVIRIGPFVSSDGTPFAETMTDVAVDKNGKLAACTVAKIYDLELPSGGSGDVKTTQRVAISGGNRFYALAYAPAGVLSPAEELVGGDAAGDLYWIPASGAPSKIGNFGTVAAGDPGGGVAGNVWQLSGDIAFFINDGAPIGLATVRPCDKPGDTSTCRNGNDVVIELDVAALSTKSPTSILKKRYVGAAGTGFGRLYGVAAWEDKVYAFQRVTTTATGVTALLVAVSLADGKGTVVKDFPEIAAAKNGWSGAGVTTSAKVFIPK